MNNLQYIVKNDTRAAMHMAVELCEQGDFDTVNEALWWLLQERDDAALGGGECENIAYYPLVNFECSECGCTVEGGDELGANIQHGAWNHCPNCGKAVKR